MFYMQCTPRYNARGGGYIRLNFWLIFAEVFKVCRSFHCGNMDTCANYWLYL